MRDDTFVRPEGEKENAFLCFLSIFPKKNTEKRKYTHKRFCFCNKVLNSDSLLLSTEIQFF